MIRKILISRFRPFIFLLIFGLFFGGVFYFLQHQKRENALDTQMSELRESFPTFLAERLKKEKKESRLLKVDIVSVKASPGGLVNVAYSIFFDDMVSGEIVPSSVEATATLRRDNDVWRLVSISTAKEAMDFQN